MSRSWKSLNRRYQAERELSRSGPSAVYLARDLENGGQRTALKIFRVASWEIWSRALREFDLLRRLQHPHIARVYQLGKVETVEPGEPEAAAVPAEEGPPGLPQPGDAFLAFEYLDGLDLRAAFLKLFPAAAAAREGSGPNPAGPGLAPAARRWKIFYQALAHIGLGLEAIHSRGLIHNDLKPENLLLIPAGGDPNPQHFEAKIIDFGFAQEETTPVGRRIRGTVPYIAPEVLTSSSASPQSDLYSLGIAIYTAVTGTFPFPAEPLEAWIEAILRPQDDLDVQPPRDVPPALHELLRQLTRKDPRERLASAADFLKELKRIESSVAYSQPQGSQHAFPALGWERELGLLRSELEELRREESSHSLILIETDQDNYTEPFVEEIETLASLNQLRCLRGRTRFPYQLAYSPVSEVLNQLIRKLDLASPRYRKFLPALGCIFPDLAREKISRHWEVLSPREAKLNLIDAVVELFQEASQESPLVLVLEDLQLADQDTLLFLEGLSRQLGRQPGDAGGDLFGPAADAPLPPAPGAAKWPDRAPGTAGSSRVLLIGTYRDRAANPALLTTLEEESLKPLGDSTSLAQLASLPFCLKLKLKWLGLEQLEEWLRHRFPAASFSEKEIRKLHELTGGSPRLLDETIKDLERARSREESGGEPKPEERREVWLLDPELAGGSLAFRYQKSLREMLLDRLQGLSKEELEVLEALAVAGSPADLKILGALLGDGSAASASGPAGRAIQILAERGLLHLRYSEEGAEISWTHDALQSPIYLQIPEERRRQLHERMLNFLLSDPVRMAGGQASEAAVQHAWRAGALEAFFNCGLAAGESYLRAYSFSAAVRVFEGVLQGLNESTAGQPRDFASPAPPADRREQIHWSVLRQLGEIYRLSKDFSRALEKFTVLLSLEENDPNLTRRSDVYRLMGEIYQEKNDPVNALYFLEKSFRLLEAQPYSRARTEALLALANFHHLRGNLDLAEATALKTLDHMRSSGDGDLYARVCLKLGEIYSKRNDQARSLTYNLKALEAARNFDHLPQVLEATSALGAAFMARGEYERAIEHFTRGIELSTVLGSKNHLARFYNQIGTIQFNRANHMLALENFQRSLRLWSQIGDLHGIANCYNNIGLALRLKDDLQRAAECYRRAIDIFSRIGDEFGQAAGMNNLANILELQGKYQEALDYAFQSLEKRKKFNSKSGIAFSYYRIGKIYQSKGELDKALGYAEKSLQIRWEISEKMGIAYSKIHLAELLLLRGQLADALQKCEEGEKEFTILENQLGCLVAREILASIYIQMGELQKAAEILDEVAAQARESHQTLLLGNALHNLAKISMEMEDLHEAETRFEQAEAIFKEHSNHRELAELLLDRSRLYLDFGHHERAANQLEGTYAILEEFAIRDLVPFYFLLRGQLEMEIQPSEPDRGKKFLERALLEAREVSLPEILWQVHYRLGLLDRAKGSHDSGQAHFSKALEILDSQKRGLAEGQTTSFYQIRSRRMLLRLVAAGPPNPLAGGGPEDGAAVFTAAAARPFPSPFPAALEFRDRNPSQLQSELFKVKSLNRRLLKLQEINQAINSEHDLKLLLEKVMDAVLDLVDAERGFLILATVEKTGQERVTVARNIDKQTVEKPEDKISHSISSEVIRTGKPVLTTNAVVDDRFLTSKSVQDLRLISVLCVPLRSHDQVLGMIYLDNRQRRNAFRESDLQLLETFCDQATIAINNARLTAELSTRNVELTELNRQREILNQRLLQEVQERNSELHMTRERMRKQLSHYESHLRFHNIIGKSERMQQIFQVLERVAPTNLPVLIEGESGTGKELIARAIHANSQRKDNRFISENCAALSDSLLESELFGHTRGAFTGAISDRKGLFEIASGGTLLLDEVGDMSLSMQKKLLRVLEESELRKVGGKDTLKVDVRILSASNRDLRKLVEAGSFREDLYYRLHGVRIELPSLRERKEDIPLLIQHFLEEISRELQIPKKVVTPEALRLLVSHSWPGNVRELKHFLERTILLVEGNSLRAEDCVFDSQAAGSFSALSKDSGQNGEYAGLLREIQGAPLRRARDLFMKLYVESCYRDHHFNASRAAKACGMSRESFHRFLKKFKISKARSVNPPEEAGPAEAPASKPPRKRASRKPKPG
ncbi:MAG: sigma 54-interacting transcriptional regulator [Planctomycetes bacterium]|nr:sigma 54-interacting transcriptional regulator [Planctomycetota bacterium]